MSSKTDFNSVFETLKGIMNSFATNLILVKNEEHDYYLDTPFIMKNKKPLFFGAVNIKKNYVSYHLMPVYVYPELLEGISPELKKRMQGKSCFNFKKVDEALFQELAELTQKGYDRYKQAKYF